MIRLINCPICDVDNWEYLDYLRDKDFWYNKDWLLEGESVLFKICKNCGFVTYDYRDAERLKNHYDKERTVMNENNIITCNRKNKYHELFLKELDFSKFSDMLDVGCAQGAFLNMLQQKYPNCNYYGTEWSEAFRSWAMNEYDLKNITQDIDYTKQYDFISYYHVLEHCQNPDGELKKIREILKDDGYLYISVPVWFNLCDETSGAAMESFEIYYHLNHIDVFSKISVKNLLKTTGFEIIKENNNIYGYTILCKKCEPSIDIEKENYQDIIKILETQKKAIECLQKGKSDEAIEAYPKFPDAYIIKSMHKDVMKDFEAQKKIIENGLKVCGECTKLVIRMAQLLFQWDENTPDKRNFYSNNIRESERLFFELAESRPGVEDNYYFLSLINAKYKKDYDMAVYYMKKIIEINPKKWPDCMNYIATFWRDKQ